MNTKPKAAKTVTAKKPAAKEASRSRAERNGQASRSSGTDAPDADDLEWAEIERMWDVTPQELWGVDQWRKLAVYLSGAYQRVVAQLAEANKSHDQTMALLRGVIEDYSKASLHSRALRELEQHARAGRVVIDVSRQPKKAGRPKTPEQDRLRRQFALVTLAAKRGGPAAAAAYLAESHVKKAELKAQKNGKSFTARAREALLARRKRSLQTEISAARRQVRQLLRVDHGQSLEVIEALKKLDLLPKRRGSNTQKNLG